MPLLSNTTDENLNPLLNGTNTSRCSTHTPISTPPPPPPLTSSPLPSTHTSCGAVTAKTLVSLKRKRPLKLQIPRVLGEIQVGGMRSSTGGGVVEGGLPVQYGEMGVGVFCKKGKKKVMEDAYKIVLPSKGNSNKGFYGVYDGHGGLNAAKFVADNLHENILKMLENCEGNVIKEEAVKAGYLKTDDEFFEQGVSSGTCCVTCIIEEKDIIVSNVGDCRAILCRGGVAEALTIDHRAEKEDERRRIEKKGGYVEFHRGAWRVHGILSVSRSIGDVHMKDWVQAEPDTKILELTPDMDFIVLASDGLWEKVGNQEAVDIALCTCFGPDKMESTNDSWTEGKFGCENVAPPSQLRRISLVKRQKIKSPLQEIEHSKSKPNSDRLVVACKELVNLAVTRGSLDDITVMIINMRRSHQM